MSRCLTILLLRRPDEALHVRGGPLLNELSKFHDFRNFFLRNSYGLGSGKRLL
jgi:hypothetical protein